MYVPLDFRNNRTCVSAGWGVGGPGPQVNRMHILTQESS